MSDAYRQVEVTSRSELRQWLQSNHASSPGIWLVTFKKSSGGPHVSYDEIVQEALCFGWIDSRPRKVDDQRTGLLLTPRKPGSRWSRPNKQRVERLLSAGLMAPAGLAAVEAAKSDGAWAALDEVENLIEPDDLARALDANPGARQTWDGFPPSARRGILEWILDAKRPDTRGRRIAETVSEAAAGRRANRWPRTPG